jgi:hypothetical protein
LQNNNEIWLAGTLATTKPLDLEGEEEEEEEAQEERADLDPVRERRERKTSDLNPSLPISSEPHRRPRLQRHGGHNARGWESREGEKSLDLEEEGSDLDPEEED